jgi:predicted nucleic acid-binding protein
MPGGRSKRCSRSSRCYPDDALLQAGVRGATTYGLSWFDAHMRAYAERVGLDTIWSEDIEHSQLYGRVRVVNPFV